MKKLLFSNQLKGLAAMYLILLAVIAFPLSVAASPKHLSCRVKGPYTSRLGSQSIYTLNESSGTIGYSKPWRDGDIPVTYPATYTPYKIVGVEYLGDSVYLERVTIIDRTNGEITVETKTDGKVPGWTVRGTCRVYKPLDRKF